MYPAGNVRQTHHQQPPPLNPFDRLALMFMYAVGFGIAYNALPRGINKPVSFMILGAGLWHAGGCSCRCLQELGRGFFRASSHGGGSYSTHNIYYMGGDGSDPSPQSYCGGGGGSYPPPPSHAPKRKPNPNRRRDPSPPPQTSSYGGWGSGGGGGGGGGDFSSFSSFGGGTSTNSTMGYTAAPTRKKK